MYNVGTQSCTSTEYSERVKLVRVIQYPVCTEPPKTALPMPLYKNMYTLCSRDSHTEQQATGYIREHYCY